MYGLWHELAGFDDENKRMNDRKGCVRVKKKSEKYWGPRRNGWAGAVMAVRKQKQSMIG